MKNCLEILVIAALLTAAGCTPEVGSEKWCRMLEEKPKREWTGNEATDYAKHCIFR